MKCEGEGEIDTADGLGVRVEGGVKSQWSRQLLRDMVLCGNQVATQQCWSSSIVIVRL